jgi:hypothetical protein
MDTSSKVPPVIKTCNFMTQRGKMVTLLSVVWFVVGTAYYAHRGILQIIAVPLLFGMLTAIVLSFVWVFGDWRRVGWRAALPFLICVLSVVSSFALAIKVRQKIFEWSLPSYEAVVRQMLAGKIAVTTNRSWMPELVSQARFAYSVSAWRETNGVLTVEILTEGGFPVKHSGYLFCSGGVIAPGSIADERWPARRQLKPQWFYITN